MRPSCMPCHRGRQPPPSECGTAAPAPRPGPPAMPRHTLPAGAPSRPPRSDWRSGILAVPAPSPSPTAKATVYSHQLHPFGAPPCSMALLQCNVGLEVAYETCSVSGASRFASSANLRASHTRGCWDRKVPAAYRQIEVAAEVEAEIHGVRTGRHRAAPMRRQAPL